MIEVIKKPIVEVPKETICPNLNCQAGLRYRRADIQHNYGTQWDPVDKTKWHYITCPCCGTTIYVTMEAPQYE